MRLTLDEAPGDIGQSLLQLAQAMTADNGDWRGKSPSLVTLVLFADEPISAFRHTRCTVLNVAAGSAILVSG